MIDGSEARRGLPAIETRRQTLFYRVVLPLGVLANLALGLVILVGLDPHGWPGWLEMGTGALCCVIGGWLTAAAWSRSYWNRTLTRQVASWRRITDVMFAWVEEAPLPVDAVRRLKTALDEAMLASHEPVPAPTQE